MKLLSLWLFATLASAAAIPNDQAKLIEGEELVECCYTWSDGTNVAIFRTSEIEGLIHSTPRPWCTATFARDAKEPNNCIAATAKVYAGYCSPSGAQLTPVDCT